MSVDLPEGHSLGEVDMLDRSYNMAVIDGQRYLMDDVPGDLMDGSTVEYSSHNPRGLFPRVDIHRIVRDEPAPSVPQNTIPMISTIVLGPGK